MITVSLIFLLAAEDYFPIIMAASMLGLISYTYSQSLFAYGVIAVFVILSAVCDHVNAIEDYKTNPYFRVPFALVIIYLAGGVGAVIPAVLVMLLVMLYERKATGPNSSCYWTLIVPFAILIAIVLRFLNINLLAMPLISVLGSYGSYLITKSVLFALIPVFLLIKEKIKYLSQEE